jgi:putative transcriptional regulator
MNEMNFTRDSVSKSQKRQSKNDFPDTERDSAPMTEAELKRAPRVPRVKTLRRAMGLTQEQFSERFMIPLGTLRDWEQGVTEPDGAGRAYLRAIIGDAQAVERALRTIPAPPAPAEAA